MSGPLLGTDVVWMDLIRALGLDPDKTQDVSLHLPMDGVATIEARMIVNELGDCKSIVDKKFVLKEVDENGNYIRTEPDNTFALAIETPRGTYGKSYPLDMAGDPKYRGTIVKGLEQALDEIAAANPVSE